MFHRTQESQLSLEPMDAAGVGCSGILYLGHHERKLETNVPEAEQGGKVNRRVPGTKAPSGEGLSLPGVTGWAWWTLQSQHARPRGLQGQLRGRPMAGHRDRSLLAKRWNHQPAGTQKTPLHEHSDLMLSHT